jgi:hypothetical protein
MTDLTPTEHLALIADDPAEDRCPMCADGRVFETEESCPECGGVTAETARRIDG